MAEVALHLSHFTSVARSAVLDWSLLLIKHQSKGQGYQQEHVVMVEQAGWTGSRLG